MSWYLAVRCLAGAAEPAPERFTPDMERCRGNLRLMNEALAAYRLDHQGGFPPKLGDLLGKYLTDPARLKCSGAEGSGNSGVVDPTLIDPSANDGHSIGLNWEMSAANPEHWEGNSLGMSFSRFKLLQLHSLVGRFVPVVRCSNHGGGKRWLNLTANGMIYESGVYWEDNFLDILPRPRLAPELIRWGHLPMNQLIAPRPDGATAAMLDLRPWYNARFDDPWIEAYPGQELISFGLSLRDGLLASGRTLFEPAGVIQLNGMATESGYRYGFGHAAYPAMVANIQVSRAFAIMHVLGGVAFGSPDNSSVARFKFFREGSTSPLIWEWRYGVNVAELSFKPGEENDVTKSAVVAWRGDFEKSQVWNRQARLFHVQFVNPEPAAMIASLKFECGEANSGPFIAAITFE